MPRKNRSVIEDLILGPWWLSAGLAVLGLLALPLIQGIATANPFFAVIKPFWPLMMIGLLALSGISALRAWANGRMLDRQTGLDSLASLSWKEFEDLMAEAYRRRGYEVEETLGGGADGGIDLVLRRGGSRVLVQCKRWRNKPVPVAVVREVYGLLMAETSASSAVVVTTSTFTSEAVQFAHGKPIELIGGSELLELLRSVQTNEMGLRSAVPTVDGTSVPSCPICDSEMVRRNSRRGSNAGSAFWGCPKYPDCRGTRAL